MGMYSRLFIPFSSSSRWWSACATTCAGIETSYANARYQQDAGELAAHCARRCAGAGHARSRPLDTALSTALLLNADLAAARLDYAGGHLEALRSQPAEPDYPAGSRVSAPLRPSTAPSISATPRC
jgi:hypothetical protein